MRLEVGQQPLASVYSDAMNADHPSSQPTPFEDAPALVAGSRNALWLDRNGEIKTLSHRDAQARLLDGLRPLVCHRKTTAAALRA